MRRTIFHLSSYTLLERAMREGDARALYALIRFLKTILTTMIKSRYISDVALSVLSYIISISASPADLYDPDTDLFFHVRNYVGCCVCRKVSVGFLTIVLGICVNFNSILFIDLSPNFVAKQNWNTYIKSEPFTFPRDVYGGLFSIKSTLLSML